MTQYTLSDVEPVYKHSAHRRAIVSKSRRKSHQKYKHDLFYRLSALLRTIKHRCESPKHSSYRWYGARGIKNHLILEDLLVLWARDKAWTQTRPSVDRRDRDGDYCFDNCEFVPLKENLKRRKSPTLLPSLSPDSFPNFPGPSFAPFLPAHQQEEQHCLGITVASGEGATSPNHVRSFAFSESTNNLGGHHD